MHPPQVADYRKRAWYWRAAGGQPVRLESCSQMRFTTAHPPFAGSVSLKATAHGAESCATAGGNQY